MKAFNLSDIDFTKYLFFHRKRRGWKNIDRLRYGCGISRQG